jgi:hypothetical protein
VSEREEQAETARQTELSVEFVQGGIELAGASAGAAVGLIGGPVGAMAGAGAGVVVTRVLKRVGAELQSRSLGPRQRIRAGAAFAIAIDEVDRKLQAGEQLPTEWMKEKEGGRREAEEILEGLLLAATDAWEEHRVRHLGLLYASLVFSQNRPEYCHYLVTLAGRLTWRQMVALAVFACDQPTGFKLFEQAADVTIVETGLEAELDELGQSGIFGFRQQDGSIARPASTLGGGRLFGAEVENVVPTSLGQTLADSLMLDRIAKTDRQAMRESLEGRVPRRDIES